MKRTGFFASTAATLAALFAGGVFFAPSASAATGGNCALTTSTPECLVLWYNSNNSGSHTTFNNATISNFAGYTFLSSGAGQGQPVKNNAASAVFGALTSGNHYGVIFFNSGFGGPCDQIYAGGRQAAQLVNTYNDNASYASYDFRIPGCYDF
jgi:hypothetical protein